jgi:hypothetical protein
MRKLILPAALVTALAAASLAFAHGGFGGAASPSAVAGTFTATQVKTSSRTCTTSDNRTIVVTDGSYTGTASGDATLTGAITLRARSVVDTTNKVGLVTGRLGIDTSSHPDTSAMFQAVYADGHVAGLAAGRAAHAALVANLSADFDPATGFANGKLGGGTAGGNAVELTAGACKQSSGQSTHERSAARGTISALSSSSITVAGLTCTLPQGSDASTKFKQGDVVSIACELSNGANTLTKISGKHH